MRTDILLDQNYDPVDMGTEWNEGESDSQHAEILMICNKGEFKEFPFIGFGAAGRLKGVFNKNKIIRDMKIEMENDGYANYAITLTDDLEDFKIEL